MPRKKARRSQQEPREFFVFEIKSWEPSYSFSLNRQKYAETDYSEYAELHFETACTYPDKYAGRTASMILSSRRGLLDPFDPRRDPSEIPTNIGLLELPPRGGSFYGGLPHETMTYFLSGLAAERIRYLMLSGVRERGSNFRCTELHFERTQD